MGDEAIRRCDGSWTYCDGDCKNCPGMTNETVIGIDLANEEKEDN